MKKQMLMFLLVAVLSGLHASISYANTPDRPEVVAHINGASEGKSVSLVLSNLDKKMVEIVLMDRQQEVLYSEEVSGEIAYAKRMDLTQLPDGDYMLTIDHPAVTIEQAIRLSNNGTELSQLQRKVVYKPVITAAGGYVEISLPEQWKGEMEVSIFDSLDNEVFAEDWVPANQTSRRYNLKQLPAGTYAMRLEANGQTYYQTVTL